MAGLYKLIKVKMRTKSCFPVDPNAPRGPKQRLWVDIIDKDTNVTFKGVLTRQEFEEVNKIESSHCLF